MRLAHHISGVGSCGPKGDRARHELGRSRISGEDRAATSTARRQQYHCRSLSAQNGNGRYPPGDSMCEDDATPHGWAYNGTKWPAKADMYLYRSDGQSCSRELVTPSNKLRFAYPSTHQYLLVWNSRPQCVMVIKKLGTELMPQFLELVQWLGEDQGLKVMVEPACYECLSALPGFSYVYTFTPAEEGHLGDLVDFVVCLGGDGVLLHASDLYKHSMPPVVSFHLGSLGFLTNHQFSKYKRELVNIIDGRDQLSECAIGDDKRGFMITLRMRLLCQIHRQGNPQAGQRYEVLNEVVLDRGLAPYLTNIECYESGKLVTIVQADGVMLATPTGSTAYSGAAGGAMVHPNVPAILLTPICPHSLSFRPIILPDYADVELRVPDNARCGAWVCFDGKSRQELQRGDSVIVRMSPNPVPTINNIDQTSDWFAGLERCFGWSARSSVQKPLESSPLH